jgi:UDP-N-acetylglucosamine 2-epimerase (non-hydrolysing)
VLQKEQPETVLVQGDTNTVLGGALAAAKLRISVGHVEAGLRSYDRSMPEEINRVLTDHISDYLFAPTPVARDHLISEGIDAKKIFTTGNTIVDAVRQNLAISRERHDVLEDMGLDRGKYFLATVHRAENVDDRDRLRGILEGLECISEEFSLPIIFPVHPRTRKRIRDFKLSLVTITETRPLGFMDFLQLEANARCVLTDSGGVQEESCILGVPCVTLRDNTERPETLDVGANILAGANAGKVRDAVRTMLSNGKTWENPFGDGRSGETIVRILTGQEV